MLERDVNLSSPTTPSPWASGGVMVSEKDGSKCSCMDNRMFNDVSVKESYPVPQIDDFFFSAVVFMAYECRILAG